MSKKYIVEFTKEQIKTVARGLEFYSRFLAGQWRIPDEWKEESINYLWGEVDNLMNEYTTYHKDLIKFEYCLANYPSKVND